MITSFYIALWAWLFTQRLTMPGQIFAPVRAIVQRLLGDTDDGWGYYIFYPLFVCPKCHAGQVSFWYCIWQWYHGQGFNIQLIITAVFVAAFLEDHYDNFFGKRRGG
jgi:hypothetical protein